MNTQQNCNAGPKKVWCSVCTGFGRLDYDGHPRMSNILGTLPCSRCGGKGSYKIEKGEVR